LKQTEIFLFAFPAVTDVKETKPRVNS